MAQLGRGEFIGDVRRTIATPGFQVSLHHSAVDPATVMSDAHTHSEAHLMWVVSPGYCSDAWGAPGLSRGALLIYNPAGTEHRDYFVEAGGRFLALAVPRASEQLAAEVSRLPTAPVVVEGAGPNRLVRQLAAAAGAATPDPLHLQALGLELLAALQGAEDLRGREPPSWLGRAKEYLVEEEAGRIEQIGRAVGVHPVHLARVFRASVGCTPGEYRRRHRADDAARRLQGQPTDLAELALSLGYADQSHFTNEFGRWYGCSPRVFARRCW